MEFRYVIKGTIIMTRFEFYGNLNKYHDTNSLEHKESLLKGSQRRNAKYIRREGEPGNYKYIYKEVNEPNGEKKVVAEEWNFDDHLKTYNNEQKRVENIYKDFDAKSAVKLTTEVLKEYDEGKASAEDVIDAMEYQYSKKLEEEFGRNLYDMLKEAQAEDDAEEDPDDKDNVDKFIKKIKKRTAELQENIAKQEKMNQQNYENRKNADKYAEEDRWTDYNDKKEREESLKKYSKEMGLNEKQTELLNKYIKSNDYSDLKALEKELSSTEQAVLNSYLMRLQKESFMGHRVRKDGSLR